MDKLKPVLAHKFWIFFGIVLILPLVGYFMTKGGLAKEIEDRRTSLNTTFTGIPAGVDSANDLWIAQAKLANEKLELHNRQANKALWDVQYAKMRWPKDVAPIMRVAEYFKPVPPEKGGSKAADKYQDAYPEELRQLWEIVDPLDDGGRRAVRRDDGRVGHLEADERPVRRRQRRRQLPRLLRRHDGVQGVHAARQGLEA